MKTRLLAAMARSLDVDPARLGPDASPRTVAEWDSLKHMSLVLDLEREFGVEFAEADIPELTSVARIEAALGARLLKAG
jgi:acyl carrier protein